MKTCQGGKDRSRLLLDAGAVPNRGVSPASLRRPDGRCVPASGSANGYAASGCRRRWPCCGAAARRRRGSPARAPGSAGEPPRDRPGRCWSPAPRSGSRRRLRCDPLTSKVTSRAPTASASAWSCSLLLCQVVRRQADIYRAEVVVEVLDPLRAGDRHDVVPLRQHPRERELAGRAALRGGSACAR